MNLLQKLGIRIFNQNKRFADALIFRVGTLEGREMWNGIIALSTPHEAGN